MLKGAPLQPGWLGKNFACHQLANATDARYLVFVDADVRLGPEAVAAAISKMNEWGWDFISPYPKQIARSFIERLVQPLLQWSWFASVPLRFAEMYRLPSMAVANGQFLIIKSSAYVAVGGHEAIKGEVIDDVELSRALIRAKFKGFVAEGSQISQCRMYKSGQELIAGYAKSQWRAFRNLLGAAVAVLILFLSSVLPAIFALQGSKWGFFGYLAMVGSRTLVALRTGTSILTAPLHPLSALIWIALIKYSWIQKWRGKLVWKERAV
ncbi:MAG: glycosyltransferase family 2 protein [Gammaproteobacteria bacterium]|nr:glycosyltransferase family 2 protein [Gammaproteobacteria bacterium]